MPAPTFRRIVVRALIASVCVVVQGASSGRIHPLHTTITTIAYDTASHQATVTVRVFTSDLDTAIARRTRGRPPASRPASDSASFAYLASVFSAAGRDGRPLPIQWCGSGDVRVCCSPRATEPSRCRSAVRSWAGPSHFRTRATHPRWGGPEPVAPEVVLNAPESRAHALPQ